MTALPTSPAGRPSASLHYAVGELSGKVDQILLTIIPQINDLKAADQSLSNRVTSLERLQWGFYGVVSIGGVLWAIFEKLPHVFTLIKVIAQ
jgi:hypothetical protein